MEKNMEKNLDTYIRRLIELDSKAVAYKGQRDAELQELEVHSSKELRRIDTLLENAASIAKQRHDEIIDSARLQIKDADEAASLKISKLQAAFLSFKEDAAKAVWKQLLEIER